jgi:hypothetical protein
MLVRAALPQAAFDKLEPRVDFRLGAVSRVILIVFA